MILEVLVQADSSAEYRSQWQGIYIRIMVMCGCVVVPSDNFYLNQPVYAIKQMQLVW